MKRRIRLIDIDRPGEPLEVEIERMTETVLRVAVPNTIVKFELRRHREDWPFEGGLGGRYFMYDDGEDESD
ncbi:MAG: hypothetical protein C3F11_14975 [Methylocystaceae bacterium]|nr:MAG: hypothetical protein C3F11_14975 [Methylocystaceae bacterium]